MVANHEQKLNKEGEKDSSGVGTGFNVAHKARRLFFYFWSESMSGLLRGRDCQPLGWLMSRRQYFQIRAGGWQ
jgi:hypothetical protein